MQHVRLSATKGGTTIVTTVNRLREDTDESFKARVDAARLENIHRAEQLSE